MSNFANISVLQYFLIRKPLMIYHGSHHILLAHIHSYNKNIPITTKHAFFYLFDLSSIPPEASILS